MAEIIKAIVAVKFWQMKMLNEDYIKIWKKDLKKKYNISERIVDVALAMLYDQNYEKHDDFDYPWHLRIGVDSSIWSGCNKGCECMICSEEEYLPKQLTEYDQDSEDYRIIQNQLKKYSKISCKCQNSWVDDNLVFLRNNIYHQMKLIPNDLKQRFMTHVTAFEARKTEKDFHPHSKDQMLDIIHPSLYCFVRAITPVTEEAKPLLRYSSQLQWIPAEFSVIRDESSNLPIHTEIRSSINNLDRNNPLNAELYQDIAEIFTYMVPGFEKILNKLKEDDRILALQGSSHPSDDFIHLKDCKVIVKIASTLVNAEKPEFKEGSWHLEGVHSEMIIATGIYYYDVKNIKQSYLRFRTTMKNEYLNYPQNCHEYVHLHYGLKLTKFDDPDSIQYNESAANSLVKLGRIPTKEDMCLFFPNFLQHRVSNVCLEDGATEGHRSILVFFLINPFGRVISSSDIPVSPQETMTLEEAKLCRELLMFERQYEYTPQDQFHQRLISLCEH